MWMLPLSDLMQLHQWNSSSQANIANIADTYMHMLYVNVIYYMYIHRNIYIVPTPLRGGT